MSGEGLNLVVGFGNGRQGGCRTHTPELFHVTATTGQDPRMDRTNRTLPTLASNTCSVLSRRGISMSSFCQWRKRIVESPISTALPRRSNSAQMVAAPLRAAKTEASSVRVTIESLGLIIDCHGDVLQNLDTVLTWATRQRQSGFKQFIVRN